jgi:Isochorismatase family
LLIFSPTFPELVEPLPRIDIIDRATVNAFDDARVSHAIEATGRKKLIFAGVSLEICAALPAMTRSARAWTRMLLSTPAGRSARPSVTSGSCACCRQA